MQARCLWSLWRALLLPYALTFTNPSYRRFVEWLTGLVLNVEEHTITQSLIGLDRVGDWRTVETFAEYAAWDLPAIEIVTAPLLMEGPARTSNGSRDLAGADHTAHRASVSDQSTCP